MHDFKLPLGTPLLPGLPGLGGAGTLPGSGFPSSNRHPSPHLPGYPPGGASLPGNSQQFKLHSLIVYFN